MANTGPESLRPAPIASGDAKVRGGEYTRLPDADAPTRSVTDDDDAREAILRSLYDERAEYNRKRRLDGLTANEEAYLADLNEYIDRYEKPEVDRSSSALWAQLDQLAASLLTAIETKNK
jgi:hypothetical protein